MKKQRNIGKFFAGLARYLGFCMLFGLLTGLASFAYISYFHPADIGAYGADSGSFLVTDGTSGKFITKAQALDSLGVPANTDITDPALTFTESVEHELGSFNLRFDGASNNHLFLQGANRRIGMGTNSPLGNLHIQSNTQNALYVVRSSTSQQDIVFGNLGRLWAFKSPGNGATNTFGDFVFRDQSASRDVFHIEGNLPAQNITALADENGFGIRSSATHSNGEFFLGWHPAIEDTISYLLGYRQADGGFVRVTKSSISGGGGGTTNSVYTINVADSSTVSSPVEGDIIYQTADLFAVYTDGGFWAVIEDDSGGGGGSSVITSSARFAMHFASGADDSYMFLDNNDPLASTSVSTTSAPSWNDTASVNANDKYKWIPVPYDCDSIKLIGTTDFDNFAGSGTTYVHLMHGRFTEGSATAEDAKSIGEYTRTSWANNRPYKVNFTAAAASGWGGSIQEGDYVNVYAANQGMGGTMGQSMNLLIVFYGSN